ncbi:MULTISPECIES: DUF1281 domain-containing protein [unclassified Pantoea]|uniref:DUF1281 domain-containing protein n=1 Tax=unclassified Pantoea TaxID=2630326 RepID=UPI001E453D3B|nr:MULTISPECIES: DUF1281 domain-containing protein [unclassified Pantoea]
MQQLTEEQITPNCSANRLRFTDLAENFSQVRALITGEVRPSYARAEKESIQLFLTGSAGLLHPVTNEMYTPYPALTAAVSVTSRPYWRLRSDNTGFPGQQIAQPVQ